MSTNNWFKIRTTPTESRHFQQLAKRRGKDASEYIRWLIDQDAQVQCKSLPKQSSFLLEETALIKSWKYE